ncbi:MAG TPA: peptide deformylase [Clostridiales bacterium]|jgi:peptide deformylase|nr:peptide deformylase [Clostridiales bacterium]
MALREIALIGDDILRLKAKEVTEFDQSLSELIDDMAKTMYHNQGAGLAAPQVSILKRVVVIDVGQGLVELVNPKITKIGNMVECEEGCLSVPGKRGKVMRPQTLTVVAYDRHGKKVKYNAEGYFAQAISHEIDHLDGILYIDKVIEGTLETITPKE